MAGLVLGRELRVVVHLGDDHPQRDEPPVDGVLTLGHDTAHPPAGQPGERADRVEVEVDVRSTVAPSHALTLGRVASVRLLAGTPSALRLQLRRGHEFRFGAGPTFWRAWRPTGQLNRSCRRG